MANYFDDGIAEIPLLADGDLTAQQWAVVSPASAVGYAASCDSGCNPIPLGILTNNPCTGEAAAIKALGFTKAKARANSCYLKYGGYLFAASDAFLEPVSDLAASQIGIARWFGPQVTSEGASVYGCVLVNCFASGCTTSAS